MNKSENVPAITKTFSGSETARKAPLCKGSCREAAEGLFVKEYSVRYNPSVTASRATSLCTRKALKVQRQALKCVRAAAKQAFPRGVAKRHEGIE